MLLVLLVLVFVITPTLFGANLWQDNFDDNKLDAVYETPDGGGGAGPPQWVEAEGAAKQIEPKPGDPTYLAVELDEDIGFAGQLVRIRFDEWQDHDRSRAGVGFWLDPADEYNGYTTVIHNSLTVGNYQFLNDARAWHGTQFVGLNGGAGTGGGLSTVSFDDWIVYDADGPSAVSSQEKLAATWGGLKK